MNAPPSAVPCRPTALKSVFLECLAVLLAGVGLALLANGLSARGLKLTRNYFPSGISRPVTGPKTAEAPPTPTPASNPSAGEPFVVQTNAQGLQIVSDRQALQLFRDARYESGKIVFIDARAEELYGLGHIPGAYTLNPYLQERYLPTALPVCQAAELVMVYCTGVGCEDSDYAAILLRNAGIPNPKLYVYKGGITEWRSNSLPVELGARKSGVLQNVPK